MHVYMYMWSQMQNNYCVVIFSMVAVPVYKNVYVAVNFWFQLILQFN